MSETKTNWIIELVDRITAPMRNVTSASEGTADVIATITANIDKMDEAGKNSANDLVKKFKDLSSGIANAEEFLKELKKSIEETSDEAALEVLIATYKEMRKEVRLAKEDLKGVETELKKIETSPSKSKVKETWGSVALAINQTMEIAQKFAESLNFAGELKDLQNQVKLFTGYSDEVSEHLAGKAYKIGKIYGDSGEEVAKAANAMSKQMGISFQQAFDLIEQGYKKGANLNGGMLEDLKEFSTQFKQSGITGEQAIALMVEAGKQGIFSNKAIDSIKEANLSLREMGQAQIDALGGIGLKVKDLAGKTSLEAVQIISRAMDGKSVQAQQKVITDVFRGAGEDAGMAWVRGLSSIEMDINKMPNVERAGTGIRSFLADMQVWFSDSMGGVAITLQQLSGPITTIAGLTTVISGLSNVTWIANAATKAWTVAQNFLNSAFIASPIGWIVAGIAAVTAGVIYAWDNFEGFRATIMGLWEAAKQVFTNIGDLFKRIFSPVFEAISAFKEGRWGDAAKAVGKTLFNLSPVGMAVQAGNWIADGGATKGVKEAFKRGDTMGRASFQKDQKEQADQAKSIKSDAVPGAAPSLKLNYGSNTAATTGSGISGAGGSKSISVKIDIKNVFNNVSSMLDFEKAANKIAGIINDRINDNLVTNA